MSRLNVGEEGWWAQRHGTTVTTLLRVTVLGRVAWAPGVYVQDRMTGTKYNIGERDLWPLGAVTPPEAP